MALSIMFKNQEELKAPIEGEIKGSIPKWLNGTYLRVGPGLFDCGKVTLNHFIDGYSMLSKFEIKNGRIEFHKKFLRTEAYKKALEFKEPYFPEFSTKGNISSQKGLFSRLFSTFSSVDVTDNDSLNVFKIGSDVYASTETMHITRVNCQKLEAADRVDYSKVFGVHMATAHPLVDSKDDWYNIGTSFTTGAKYQVLKIPGSSSDIGSKDCLKKASVVCSIPTSWRGYYAYYHSFGMSENLIIHIEQPLTMSELRIIDAKLKGKSIRDLFEWNEKETNRFHLVDKRIEKLNTTKFYSSVPFFFFHFSNCFEVQNFLVVDILAFPDNSVIEQMTVENLCLRKFNENCKTEARLARFVLPLITNISKIEEGVNLVNLDFTTATAIREGEKIILSPQFIGESGLESPEINPVFKYKEYNYVYGSGLYMPSAFENSLCKIDVKSGETKLWKDSEQIFTGDPKFIPYPDQKDEDEGVILAACCDPKENGKDFLLILNAKNMKEEARVIYEERIPQSIHSIFINN